MPQIYKWYVDTFVLTVFLVRLVVHMAAVWLMKKEGRILRCLAGAACGAGLEAVLFLVLPDYGIYRLVMLFVADPLITAMIFLPTGVKDLLSACLLTTGLYIFMGGIQNMALYGFMIERKPGLFYVILAVISSFLCILLQRRRRLKDQIYEVELVIQGKTLTVKGFVDTGNFLTDPYTDKPVSILSDRVLDVCNVKVEKVRYVPYHTINEKEELLRVFTGDKMIIKDGRKQIVIRHPAIGISGRELFQKENIQMILHRQIV